MITCTGAACQPRSSRFQQPEGVTSGREVVGVAVAPGERPSVMRSLTSQSARKHRSYGRGEDHTLAGVTQAKAFVSVNR